MEITFVANSRILGYRPGQVVKINEKDLTSPVRALLAVGRHLVLIDPLTLDNPNDSPKSTTDSKEHRSTNLKIDGQSDTPSSGKREERTASNSESRNGGDGGSS